MSLFSLVRSANNVRRHPAAQDEELSTPIDAQALPHSLEGIERVSGRCETRAGWRTKGGQ